MRALIFASILSVLVSGCAKPTHAYWHLSTSYTPTPFIKANVVPPPACMKHGGELSPTDVMESDGRYYYVAVCRDNSVEDWDAPAPAPSGAGRVVWDGPPHKQQNGITCVDAPDGNIHCRDAGPLPTGPIKVEYR